MCLDLDSVDDLANQEAPNREQNHTDIEQLPAEGVMEQNIGVAGIHKVDKAKHDDGQRAQNPSRHATLRRMSPDLALDTQPFADDMYGTIEDLRQVSSGITLHQDSSDNNPQVLRWNTLQELCQRLAERQSEVLFAEDLAEL